MKNKLLLAPFAAATGILGVTASVLACTAFIGSLAVTGNATCPNGSNTVTAIGLDDLTHLNMTNQVAGQACARSTALTNGGSISLVVAPANGKQLPAGTYGVTFFPGPTYPVHGDWQASPANQDCMTRGLPSPADGSLGTFTIDSTGSGNTSATLPLAPKTADPNGPTGESALCIHGAGTYGNEVPLTVL